MFHRILSLVAVGALAISCDPADRGPNPSTNEGACLSYGFKPGTTAYTNCVQREIDARRRGKLGPTYDQILVSPAVDTGR